MATFDVTYPMSKNYCAGWGVKEALREIIANALDTKANPECFVDGKTVTVVDTGGGFDLSCLMLGEGEEKGVTQIGQFREGLKLALLVLARDKFKVTLETPRFKIVDVAFKDIGLGVPGMVLTVDKYDTPLEGNLTKVTIEGVTQPVFESVVQTFLGLKVNGCVTNSIDGKMAEKSSPKAAGRLFVNGILCHSDKALKYDYSVSGDEDGEELVSDLRHGMNRDRTTLPMYTIRPLIGYRWSQLEVSDFISKLNSLKATDSEWCLVEGSTEVDSGYRRKVADEVLRRLQLDDPSMAVVGTIPASSTFCTQRGYTVLTASDVGKNMMRFLPSILRSDFEVETTERKREAREAKRSKCHANVVIGAFRFCAYDSLTDTERRVLREGVALVDYILGARTSDATFVHTHGTGTGRSFLDEACVFETGVDGIQGVFLTLTAPSRHSVASLFPDKRVRTFLIGVRRDQLFFGNVHVVAATLLHEYAHCQSNAPDESLKFEQAMDKVLSAACRMAQRNFEEEKELGEDEYSVPQLLGAARLAFGKGANVTLTGKDTGAYWRYAGMTNLFLAVGTGKNSRTELRSYLFVRKNDKGDNESLMLTYAKVPHTAACIRLVIVPSAKYGASWETHLYRECHGWRLFREATPIRMTPAERPLHLELPAIDLEGTESYGKEFFDGFEA